MSEEYKWFLKDAVVDTGMCTLPGKERLGNIIELVGEGQFISEVLKE